MIKILLYNINYGGRQSKKLNKNLKARWTILSKIIKDINPDMTIILEAWDWKKNHELKEFSQKCNFKYYYLSKSNTKHHIGLMSKIKPLKILKHKEGFHHSVLQN